MSNSIHTKFAAMEQLERTSFKGGVDIAKKETRVEIPSGNSDDL
jgi:hypothetical protein